MTFKDSCGQWWQALFSLCLLLMAALPAVAAREPSFDELHQQYLSLRNTDLEFKRLEEWRSLERALIDFSNRQTDGLQVQRALLESAILYQTLATKIEPAKNRLRALGRLEELVGRFPHGVLADDAILTEAQIVESQGNTDEARELLQRITIEYADSDMALIAANKLRGTPTTVKKNSVRDSHKPIIVLDPGHGGEDFGAVGIGGLLEKDVALDIAIKTKKIIEEKGTYRVLLTRARDQFVPLVDRMAFANEKEATLFVSIHANASVKKNLSGIETYYLDNTSDKGSAKLAERENRAVGSGGAEGSDLSFMLSDLIQNAKLSESISLARLMQKSVIAEVSAGGIKSSNLGVKSGPFYVLVGAHMPCALIEVAFIDHEHEGRRLGEQSYRSALARGIAIAIEQFR